MKTSCDIICDLLPLYADHVTSDASNVLVEEHLNECPDCRKELEQMQRPVPVKPEEVSAKPLEKIKKSIRQRKICAIIAAVLAVVYIVAGSAKLYTAQTLVSVEEAKIWTYNTKKNEANLCNLEVQGKNVSIQLIDTFSWGNEVISVRLVRSAYPRFHAFLEPLVSRFFAQDTETTNCIAVSNTQVLEVECADDTVYYRQGQQVYRYITQDRNGDVRYIYGSEEQLDGQFSRG